jgi:DNA-directed RNA polymerase subunit H
MSTNFTVIDAIFQSRMTLLDILEDRGYDVQRYRNFTPAEAALAVTSSGDSSHSVAHFAGLSFNATKKDGTTVCDVRYASLSRQKLDTFFNNISDEDASTTEVIVMLLDPLADAHHACALKQYIKFKENSPSERRKLRVSFFHMYAIVVNPLKHVLVPKHEIVPEAEHKALMDSMYITSKSKFPEIKFHVDPIARCIGAVPGDIIRITRPSASSGEAIVYRVCVV